jgi:subtilisin-like proprotein convertase family protein
MLKIFSFIFLLFLTAQLYSQSWQLVVPTDPIPLQSMKKRAVPLNSKTYQIKYESLHSQLSSYSFRSDKSITLPTSDGQMVTYLYKEDKIMETELSRKYSTIRAFEGFDEEGKRRIKFDIGAYGLNAIITSENGIEFISPKYENNKEYYHVYSLKNAPLKDMNTYCGTIGQNPTEIRHTPQSLSSLRNNNFQRLEYRFALACTGEWGLARGTRERALSDMVTSVNILNAIFEIDLGMKLILVNNNDSLIFLDPASDPYLVANEGRSILPTNTSIINTKIGSNSYDLGHVFTNSCADVGGIAYLSSICTNNKGGGVSCIGNNLARAVTQIVAHEIGHQLGANHTFHSCGDNVRIGNDFEPGSGSTIMSYGGLCGSNNIVTTSDPYYHNGSLVEIFNTIRRVGSVSFNCANKVPTENIEPVITNMPPSGLTIPKNTPFILQGKALDSNNDNLTYSWEQKDSTNNSTPLGTPSGNAPLFRSFSPQKNDFRIFPRPSSLLVNRSENFEILPSYTRNMNFSFTVRDNNKEASASVWAFTSIKVDANAGPFKITSHNQSFSAEVGSTLNLTWDVAETDKSPINCKAVDIYLSLDGELDPGNPKVIQLASNTPNDGSEVIIVPSFPTVAARIIVKASDNVFFDVNDVYFSIIEANNPRSFFEFPFVTTELCLPYTSEINLKSRGIANYTGKIKYEVTQLPEGAKAIFSKNEVTVGEDVKLQLEFSNEINTGRYVVEIRGVGEANDTLVRTLIYDVISNNFKELALVAPENSTKNAGVLPEFSWSPSFNAEYYQIQISTSPLFEANKIIYQDTTTFSSIRPKRTLDRGTLYFWRVRGQNNCGLSEFTPTFTYGTVVSNCQSYPSADLPITLSASGRPVAEAKINIDVNFDVSDVNVKKLNINHDNLRDLAVSLKSPAGVTAVLFSRQCPRRMTLDASFDDEAPNFFSCINGVDLQFKSQDSLSRFKGLSPRGQWTLLVEDLETGNGGRVNSFILEVCGDIPVDNPDLQILKTVEVTHKQTSVVSKENVSSTDKIASSKELIYTVVGNAVQGNIFLNNTLLGIGATFSQEDIDQGRIKYTNFGPEMLNPNQIITDSLGIIVQNGNGGFDGVKYLKFEIKGISTSSTNFDSDVANIYMYPNPSSTQIQLILPSKLAENSRLTIYDLSGRNLLKQLVSHQEYVNIASLEPGIYILMVEKNGIRGYGKLMKE